MRVREISPQLVSDCEGWMENLEERWKKLALTEEEDSEIPINEDELKEGKIDGEFSLVGRVFF